MKPRDHQLAQSIEWKDWLLAGLLVATTIIVYLPLRHAGFIWDDDYYVTKNPLLLSLDGLRRIWFEPAASPQYYPLTFTTFWIEHHLWGLNPPGYHLVNVLLHAVNSILLWKILRRLDAPGAWLAAAIFAVHPVCAESVAWVTERKNTLSGLFYLSALLATLKFWLGSRTSGEGEGNESRNLWPYWLALAWYFCALLSKTAAVPLPVVIGLLVWWKFGRLRWGDVCLLLPFFVVGIAMGVVTMKVEGQLVAGHLTSGGNEWQLSWPEKFAVAGRVPWFYLGKLLWPHPLIFIYPRWTIHAPKVGAYLPLIAAVAGVCVLWIGRRGWTRPVFCASLYFAALLFPVLGLIDVYFFRFSFVSDHFQYLASMGPLALAASGLVVGLDFVWKGKAVLKPVVCGALLLGLGTLTWKQCGQYLDAETLYRRTIELNPGCWMAYNNLGDTLLAKGEAGEAISCFQRTIDLYPGYAAAHYNLGVALLKTEQMDEAIAHFRKALEIDPGYANAYADLGESFLRKGQPDEAIVQLKKSLELQPESAAAQNNLGNAFYTKGQLDEAIPCYRKTLAIQPQNPVALYNLGSILLMKGAVDEAIDSFQKALVLKPDFAAAHNNLGSALLRKGRVDEAITEFRAALEIKSDYADAQANLEDALRQKGQSGK